MPQPDNLSQAEKSPQDLAAAAAQGETIQQWAAQYPTAQAQAAAAGTNKALPQGSNADTVPLSTLQQQWKKGWQQQAQNQEKQATVAELPGDIEKALAPYSDVLSALPGDYQNAITAITNGPNAKLPDNIEMPSNLPPGVANAEQGLSSAVNQAVSATEAGTGQMANALKALPQSVTTMAQDLPYADVISTLLQQKKNELLYGSTTPLAYKPSTTNWSQGLKDVANWIETGGGGTTNTNIGNQSFEQAITAGPTSSAPASSGPTGIGG